MWWFGILLSVFSLSLKLPLLCHSSKQRLKVCSNEISKNRVMWNVMYPTVAELNPCFFPAAWNNALWAEIRTQFFPAKPLTLSHREPESGLLLLLQSLLSQKAQAIPSPLALSQLPAHDFRQDIPYFYWKEDSLTHLSQSDHLCLCPLYFS